MCISPTDGCCADDRAPYSVCHAAEDRALRDAGRDHGQAVADAMLVSPVKAAIVLVVYAA
jgi:hypothetical protein